MEFKTNQTTSESYFDSQMSVPVQCSLNFLNEQIQKVKEKEMIIQKQKDYIDQLESQMNRQNYHIKLNKSFSYRSSVLQEENNNLSICYKEQRTINQLQENKINDLLKQIDNLDKNIQSIISQKQENQIHELQQEISTLKKQNDILNLEKQNLKQSKNEYFILLQQSLQNTGIQQYFEKINEDIQKKTICDKQLYSSGSQKTQTSSEELIKSQEIQFYKELQQKNQEIQNLKNKSKLYQKIEDNTNYSHGSFIENDNSSIKLSELSANVNGDSLISSQRQRSKKQIKKQYKLVSSFGQSTASLFSAKANYNTLGEETNSQGNKHLYSVIKSATEQIIQGEDIKTQPYL